MYVQIKQILRQAFFQNRQGFVDMTVYKDIFIARQYFWGMIFKYFGVCFFLVSD